MSTVSATENATLLIVNSDISHNTGAGFGGALHTSDAAVVLLNTGLLTATRPHWQPECVQAAHGTWGMCDLDVLICSW